MFNAEIIAFLGYFIILFFVALIFFFNGGNRNQEDYFLGGRSMGPWVTAMSAQASDMSAWLLMGLPGSIMAFGFGQMWIGIGLALGTAANWIFCATRLRKFSKAAGRCYYGAAVSFKSFRNEIQHAAGYLRDNLFSLLHRICCFRVCSGSVGVQNDFPGRFGERGNDTLCVNHHRVYFPWRI